MTARMEAQRDLAEPFGQRLQLSDGPCPAPCYPPARRIVAAGALAGMASEIAAESPPAERFRVRLPGRVPDFGPRGLLVFRIVWFAALALAIVGPITGTWQRFYDAGRNSGLVAGSRAGIALWEDDLTRIRFPVGRASAEAGIRPGDDIVAIDTIPVSPVVAMPGSRAGAAGAGNETDQLLFGDLLSGT